MRKAQFRAANSIYYLKIIWKIASEEVTLQLQAFSMIF